MVIEILRLMNGFQVEGLLDSDENLWNTKVLGVPVLGSDDLLPGLRDSGVAHVFIGLGTTGDTSPRRRLFQQALLEGLDLVGAIHPAAIISPSVEMGQGPTIMAAAIINTDARLGTNVIVNTNSVIEHDCIIGDHAHIATGAKLASTVSVGTNAHVGVGATVRQSIVIGEGAIVGAGAVVVDDVEPWSVVVGVPARFLKHHRPKFAELS